MRLFIATDECPESFSECLDIIRKLNVQNALIRPQKGSQIHLTLRFIGDIQDEKLSELKRIVFEVGTKHQKDELLFDKWLVFPERGPVRIIGLGSSKSLVEIHAIARELDEECAKCGLPSENREFIPHLTLARVKTDNSHGELRRLIHELPVPQLKLSVRTLILYRSYLKSDGAEYEKVFSQPLS